MKTEIKIVALEDRIKADIEGTGKDVMDALVFIMATRLDAYRMPSATDRQLADFVRDEILRALDTINDSKKLEVFRGKRKE